MALIKVVDLAYVRYRVPDPELMARFLVDFGLHEHERDGSTIYMRGSDNSPYLVVIEQSKTVGFIGPAFLADSREDLKILADRFDGSAVEANPGPGGGERVRVFDLDGYQIEIVHGTTPVDPLPMRQALTINDSQSRKRKGDFQRAKPGPSTVKRIGHLILRVDDYEASLAWYQQLGFLVSDEVHDPDNPEITTNGFLKCDRGDDWTDHHTLGLAVRKPKAIDHIAFEVIDIDDVVLGGLHLEQCGYRRSWGVGRHILGSQIFDYWRDPHGFKMEHWTDGDLVNIHTTPTRVPAGDYGPGAISQWGSTSKDFTQPYAETASIGPITDRNTV